MRLNAQSQKCFWQRQGTVVKMRNWRPLERWNWSFQQWALFYADSHAGKSFLQAVNIPHSQSKWRFGEWKTEAGAETSLTSITLTYIKPKISQIVQLLALTLFQNPTIQKYYQNENSVSNLIHFWFSACVRDLPVWISTLWGYHLMPSRGEGKNTFTVMNTTDMQNEWAINYCHRFQTSM